MPIFYVNRNKQVNGDNEVHETHAICRKHANPENRVDLGWHPDCNSAVRDAISKGYNANGCYWCANDCHTT